MNSVNALSLLTIITINLLTAVFVLSQEGFYENAPVITEVICILIGCLRIKRKTPRALRQVHLISNIPHKPLPQYQNATGTWVGGGRGGGTADL